MALYKLDIGVAGVKYDVGMNLLLYNITIVLNMILIDQQLLSSLEKHGHGIADQAKTIGVPAALNSPFLTCNRIFNINDDGVNLATGCHALLRALSEAPSILKHAYRIELLLASDKAGTPPGTLRLCVSPTEWFDYLPLAGKSEDERIKVQHAFPHTIHLCNFIKIILITFLQRSQSLTSNLHTKTRRKRPLKPQRHSRQ